MRPTWRSARVRDVRMDVGHVREGLEPVLEPQIRQVEVIGVLGLFNAVETRVEEEFEVGVLERFLIDGPEVDLFPVHLQQGLDLADDRAEGNPLRHARQLLLVGGPELPDQGANANDERLGEERRVRVLAGRPPLR
jgi:hypothetical protein